MEENVKTPVSEEMEDATPIEKEEITPPPPPKKEENSAPEKDNEEKEIRCQPSRKSWRRKACSR